MLFLAIISMVGCDNSINDGIGATEEVIKQKIPITSYYDGEYDDFYNLYCGRLYIPHLDISVPLYYNQEQYIADKIDGENVFPFGNYNGFTIVDYKEVSKIPNIKVGDKGYIQNTSENTRRMNIKCVDVFWGYNNGRYIVTENGENAMSRNDYMIYTCYYTSNKVLVCLWNII